MRMTSVRHSGWLLDALLVFGLMLATLVIVSQRQVVPVLLLAVGLGVLFAVFWRPAFGAALILALIPLEGALMVSGRSLALVAALLCFVVLTVRTALTHEGIEMDRTVFFALVFVVWGFVTMLWSSDLKTSISTWESLALQSLLYFLLVALVRSNTDLRLALWGHIVGGSVLALLLAQTFISRNFIRHGDVSTMGSNLAARIVGFNLLLSVFLFCLEKGRLARILCVLSASLAGISVVISQSRGTWYGVVLALLVMMAVSARHQRRRVLLPTIIMWVMLIFVSAYVLNTFILTQHGTAKLSQRFYSALTFSDNASNRFGIWLVGWHMFLDSPLGGHGIGTFASEFPHFLVHSGVAGIPASWQSKQPHNAFVMVATELGSIGLLLLLTVLGSVFKRLRELAKREPGEAFTLAWASALSMYLLIATLVDSAVDRRFFWYVLALITLLVRFIRKGDDSGETT